MNIPRRVSQRSREEELWETEGDDIPLVSFDVQVSGMLKEELEAIKATFSREQSEHFMQTNPRAGREHAVRMSDALLASSALNYCSKQLLRLVPAAFVSLQHLTTLQLCCNRITHLPAELCLLRHLETLVLSDNQLASLPSTIGFLFSLQELYLDRNQLATLPNSVSGLRKLRTLSIAANRFVEIPKSVMGLTRLTTFECDRNPLRAVPVEIVRFSQLTRFHVEECPSLLTEREYAAYERRRSPRGGPPSLLECSARSLIRHKRPVLYALPLHMRHYLSRAEECSFCAGPFFDHCVVRCRTIRRMDRPVPVIHELCCSHWATEVERRAALFSACPPSTPPHLISVDRREREDTLAPFNRFDPALLAKGRRILRRFTTEQLTTVLVPLSMIVDWPDYLRGSIAG